MCGRNNDIGNAVTIANESTRIKSVVKWLIPSSECARAKFSNGIFFYSVPNDFILDCINTYIM